jgi:hypothetical protein
MICNLKGGFEVIYAIVEENNQAKLNKLENYQENKPWFQVDVHLRKSEPIIETINLLYSEYLSFLSIS